MAIGGIDGISAMLDQTSASASSSRSDALKNKVSGDLSGASESELMEVCKEFEAYFVEQVMKEVEKTIPRDEEDEDKSMSQLKDFYKEEMIQTLAKDVCEHQNLGFAQQMFEQMKRNYSL